MITWHTKAVWEKDYNTITALRMKAINAVKSKEISLHHSKTDYSKLIELPGRLYSTMPCDNVLPMMTPIIPQKISAKFRKSVSNIITKWIGF